MASKDELERDSLEDSGTFSARQEIFRPASPISPPSILAQRAAEQAGENGEQTSEHLDYWRTKFGSKLPTLDLPTDRPRSAIPVYDIDEVPIFFRREFVHRLTEFADHEGVTLRILLLAGLQAVLHRYTGQEDILVGTHLGLPLRTAVASEMPFRELLLCVRDAASEANRHYCPQVEELLGMCRAGRDAGNVPAFQ